MRPRDVARAFGYIDRRSRAVSRVLESAVERNPGEREAIIKAHLNSPAHQRVRRDLKALRRRLITPLLRRTRKS